MKDQVVIVTGAGRGIGRAICRRFAKEGSRILAAARSADQLAETRRLVEAEGGTCKIVRADLGMAKQVDEIAAMAVREFGRIDVLVNNAAVAPSAPLERFDLATFDAMIAVNVSGVFYASRAVWPTMQKQKSGVIVNLSSRAAVDPFPGFAAYGASKNFVEGLTKALAAEGASQGIRVYGIGPGAVDTDMLRGPFPDFPADQCLRPDDIAEMVWQVTQPAYRYSSGQTVYVSK